MPAIRSQGAKAVIQEAYRQASQCDRSEDADRVIRAVDAILSGQGVPIADLSDEQAVDVAQFCCGLAITMSEQSWPNLIGDKVNEVIERHRQEEKRALKYSYQDQISVWVDELDYSHLEQHVLGSLAGKSDYLRVLQEYMKQRPAFIDEYSKINPGAYIKDPPSIEPIKPVKSHTHLLPAAPKKPRKGTK